MSLVKGIVGGVALLFAIIIGACSATTVGTGQVGVQTRFGEVIGEPLPAGLYFINPFTTDVHEMDTRVLRWSVDEGLQAYTKDVQQAGLSFVLNYRLDASKASVVFANVGEDWPQKLVGQIVFEEIKREVGQHEAVEIIAQRDAAARKIEANVKLKLAERDVIVTGFQLTNIDFTSEFEHAVEAKVIAQQKAIEEQNHTKQIEEQAAQQVATARGNAESTVVNAKADAESIRIRAQALEQNAKLVEWEAVQKWNGQLPTYMIGGGGAVPFINVPGGK